MAIRESEIGIRQGTQSAVPKNDCCLDQAVSCLGAMASGIHPHGPAHRAGDAAIEFQPPQTGPLRRLRQLGIGYGCACADRVALDINIRKAAP